MSAQPQPKALTLDEMAELWCQTKADEDRHRSDRIALEELILQITDAKMEGSETTKTQHYKITTTGRLTRSVDWDKYHADVQSRIPENLRPVKIKETLDVSGVKYLEENEPEIFRIFAECLETKHGKVGFRIGRLKED